MIKGLFQHSKTFKLIDPRIVIGDVDIVNSIFERGVPLIQGEGYRLGRFDW